MSQWRSRYTGIPRSIRLMVAAKFLISLLNGSFLLVLNIYLRKQGLDDPAIGSFTAMIYLGILLVGLPTGLFLRGRRLKPLFLVGAIMIPLTAVLLLESIRQGADPAISRLLLLCWGGSFVLIDSFILPFVVRNAPEESESESIALSYSMFSLGYLLSGLVIYFVTQQETIELLGWVFAGDEYFLLMSMACLNFGLLLLVLPLREQAPDPSELRVTARRFFTMAATYDWRRIFTAILPTSVIAVGAGLTIPFINLFFNSVYGMDSDTYGLLGSGTALLIFLASNAVPFLRRAFGYRIAITLSQTMSVLMLVLMALTELYADLPWMVYLAAAFYLLRTPLMNMAQPMTSELVMGYVGRDNRDLTAALMSSVWSGSWFVSAKVFQWMRALEWPYFKIFLLTAAFYAVGVALYYRLIRRYEREGRGGKIGLEP